MLVEDFELACRLIKVGPGDQPLTRLLTFAMEATDCPVAFIGARRNQVHQIIVSRGIPMFMYRDTIPTTAALTELFSKPTVIEDTWAHELMAHGPAARDGWRFVASVPLPLSILPFPVTLLCADVRVGAHRPVKMLEKLERCAAIAADEVRMIAHISGASATTRLKDRKLLLDAVSQSGVPSVLVDQEMTVLAVSERLAAQDPRPVNEQIGSTLGITYFLGDEMVSKGVQEVLKTGNPMTAIRAVSPDTLKSLLVDGVRCTSVSGDHFALLTLADDISTVSETRRVYQNSRESPGVVSEFLLNTLVRQRRLLVRGPVSYHALARWRTPIKDSQIAALKAIKRDPTQDFVDRVVDELATAAISLFGRSTLQAVAHVPCGNSGPGCLASRLARGVAKRLDIEAIVAFDDLPPSGGSHPKSNTRRGAMKLRTDTKKRVLLIDDVATSGHHIEEAATLLQKTAPAVLPLVWIGN